jgi:hypothetical protein
MAKPDILMVDGHANSWQRLCQLRREQLEAWKAARGEQQACRKAGLVHSDHRYGPTAANRAPRPLLGRRP